MKTEQIRVAFGLRPETHKRLQEVCDKFDVSQTKLFECLLLLPDSEIDKVVKAGVPAIEKNRKDRLEARRLIMSKLKTMNAQEIEAMLSEKSNAN